MAAIRRLVGRLRFLALIVAVLAIAAGDRLMSRTTQSDLPRYSFVVTIEGRQFGSFREVSGLDSEIEVVEFRDGTGGPISYIPGVTKYPPVKLTRAFTGDSALSDWITAFFAQSRTERVDGSITMLDQTGHVIATWQFENGWPSKFSGPTLRSTGTEVAIESIEIVHEGLRRVPPPR